MVRPALVFIALLAFFLGITAAAFVVGSQSGELQTKVINPVKASLFAGLENIAKAFKESPTPPDSDYSINSKSNSEVNINYTTTTSDSTETADQPVYDSAPAKPCNRYTVVHLDGSTSNLCYSAADYNALASLGGDLSGAKTFYKFHVEAAQGYQDQYDRTHSNIWLDAKASQEQLAKREQEKTGQITLEMQAIEVRGY